LSQKPAVNGQANFNIELGAPYASYGAGYIVLWNGVWTVFVTESDLLAGVMPTPRKITPYAPEYAPRLDVILVPEESQEQRVNSIQLTTSWTIDLNLREADSGHLS